MKNERIIAAITVGFIKLKILIPQDLKATSSLSTERRPNDIIEANKTDIGTVSAKINGRLNPKIFTTVKKSRCFSMMRFRRSIILSKSMTNVVTISDTINGLKFSFKMYFSKIFTF
jgi:hypothetical protein